MCERMKINEAAEILGVSPQLLRVQIRKGVGVFSKIGFAEKTEKNYNYYIYKNKVDELVGRKED